MMTFLILVLAFSPVIAAPPQDGPSPDLSAYISEALRNNPEFLVLQRKLEMLEHRLPQAEALPDPMIGLQFVGMPVNTNPFDLSLEPMTQVQVMYQQKFPAPGVRGLSRQVAAYDIDLVGIEKLGKEAAIASLVRSTWLRLAYDLRSLAIARENLGLLKTFSEIAQSRYQVGKGLLADVLQSRVEVSKMEAEIIDRRRAVNTDRARFNTILGRPVEQPLPDPAPLSRSNRTLSFPDLQASADAANPELLGFAKTAEKNRAQADLARALFDPDYTLQAGYGYRYEREGLWTAGISINLPLWRNDKQREKEAEAEAQERLTHALAAAKRNDIAFLLRRALDTAESADQQFQQYTTSIIPQARQALDAARAAWEVDKSDFMNLIMSQMKLYELELMAEMQLLQHEISLVEIDAVTGKIPGYGTGDNQ